MAVACLQILAERLHPTDSLTFNSIESSKSLASRGLIDEEYLQTQAGRSTHIVGPSWPLHVQVRTSLVPQPETLRKASKLADIARDARTLF